jgi:monoamine oxidase
MEYHTLVLWPKFMTHRRWMHLRELTGSETAPVNGGFLEGALESAEIAQSQLTRTSA